MDMPATELAVRTSPPIRIDAGPFELKMLARRIGEDHGGTLEIYADVEGRHQPLLKFDCFTIRPHWHRCYPGRPDDVANLEPEGPAAALDFAMTTLRSRFADLLGEQGFADLVEPATGPDIDAAFANVESTMRELIQIDPATL